MVGKTLSDNQAVPLVPLLLVFGGSSAIVLGFATGEIAWRFFGVLPSLWGALLLYFRERRPNIQFTATGFAIEGQVGEIPYTNVEGIACSSVEPRIGDIAIVSTDAVIRLPRDPFTDGRDVYNFLHQQLTISGSRDVPNSLSAYSREQRALFGEHLVFTYRRRGQRKIMPGQTPALAFFLATFATGIIWIVMAAVLPDKLGKSAHEGWLAGGSTLAFFSFLALLILLARYTNPQQKAVHLRKLSELGLVISPQGIALMQGPVQGQLAWRELTDIKFKNVAKDALQRDIHRSYLILFVPGANIVVPDVYDRPLAIIHRRIREYWANGQ